MKNAINKKPIRVSKRKYDKLCKERFKGCVGIPFDEMEEFDEQYKIVGFYAWRVKIGRTWRSFCGKIRNAKGLKLGRIHHRDNVPYVKGMDKRLAWSMDNYLAAILRDYIRLVEKDEYHIGSAVLEENAGMPCSKAIAESDDDELSRRWHNLLLETADMFDRYARDANHLEDIDYQKLANDAFENMKKIFMDLWN